MRLTKKCDNLYYTNAKFSSGSVCLDNNGNYTNACVDKLGQLEDIEEEIGCPLEVLLQVFKKGIWVKSDCTKNKIEHWYAQDIKVIDAGCQWDICKIRTTCNKYVGCFNYGKTWALTKEELE